MAKSLNLKFKSHPLPADWSGDVWELQEDLTARLVAESEENIGFFVTGTTAPTSNKGPFLKDGEGWYFWNDVKGEYEPDEAITLLNSQVEENSAQISIILSTYADKDYAEAKMEEAISASTSYTDGQILNLSSVYATNDYVQVIASTTLSAAIEGAGDYTDAEVLLEASARAQADGYLSGMYVIRVGAGNRVAGMAITAIEDPSGWDTTSEIAFNADVFKIYNGTSNVAPFQVVGGEVRVTGNLVLVPSDIDGLGALATEDSVDYNDVSGTKPPSNADVTLSAINGGLTVTGGGITLSGGGSIKGGMTDFNVGKGFFLGYHGGEYKFMVGDPSGAYIKWDGSNWTVNNWPSSAPTAPNAIIYRQDASNVMIESPLGAPAGFWIQLSVDGANPSTRLTSFPILQPLTSSENLTFWTGAPGYTDSETGFFYDGP